MTSTYTQELVSKEDLGPVNTLQKSLSDSSYDMVAFLNEKLPTLSLSSQTSSSASNRTSQIQTSALQIQSLSTALNTYYARASSDLTSLTDEILRSGNRLAYEVEVLRGDTNGLYDVLTDTLKDDVKLFVHEDVLANTLNSTSEQIPALKDEPGLNDPIFMSQLRLLGLVKGRLESVIHIFGEAMKWPSSSPDALMSTSLISVSAPELGMVESPEDEKVREFSNALRANISAVMESEGGGYTGLDLATQRVEELRLLASLWKGTSEEKARIRLIDGLTEMVDERRTLLDSRNPGLRANREKTSQGQNTTTRATQGKSTSVGAASGLFRNLQKLRGELYLE